VATTASAQRGISIREPGQQRPWLNFTELPPISPVFVILALLAALAATIFVVRIFTGWGLVTNLNDNYGWGLWKGFNTLVGIALGASGFTTAFAVYMLGKEKFHPIARTAVLVGILGYLSSVFSLLIDLGHPDRIIFPVVFWNPESPLFEVAWCVMLYLTVMIFEFSPAVLNRLGLKGAEGIAHGAVIPLVIGGTVLSCLHQSSLGSLFLNVPDQLDPLWYTPMLPLFFLMSAIYVGPAVVIVATTLASRALGLAPRTPRQQAAVLQRSIPDRAGEVRGQADILSSLARVIPYLLGIYLFAKILELLIAGDFDLLFDGTRASGLFLLEMSVGVVFPMLLFLSAGVRENAGWRFLASLMIIAGLMLNRVDVSIISWARPADALSYTVHPLEYGFTIGLWAGLALVFYLVALYFPVFSEHGHSPASDWRRPTRQ
jgi:Ni/Fe-hydrogenase subunit HybB-like protein